MTRDELIQLLDDALSELDEVEMHVFGQLEQEVGNAIESIRAAKSGIEQLDFPPAMTWQDEPIAIGLHYVEGLSAPVPLIRDANRPDRPWVYWDVKYNRCERVGRRRVCPIPAPPELPKRGDE